MTRTGWLRGLLRSPLLHFAVIGGAIFAFAPRREDPRVVELTTHGIGAFEQAQAARDKVAALPASRAKEVEARAIEDEVLYREALRLGLDKDDPIVRQRLIQKLLLLVEDLGGASRPPTDDALRAFFARDPQRYAQPERVKLVHVFASRPEALPDPAALGPSGVPAAGEAFPYPRQVDASQEELARRYGADFAAAAFKLEPGQWSAPIRSSFGWHRVRLDLREPPRVPSFEEVKDALAFDYALDRRAEVVGDYLKKTVREYRIEVDGQALEGFSPTHRVAVRSAPSAED